MNRPLARYLGAAAAAASFAAVLSCGGKSSPTEPTPMRQTVTFMGTTRATGPTSCAGDNHPFTAAEGDVTVTLVSSSGNVTLAVQVCAGNDDNNCTINQRPIAVGQTVTGALKGGSTQVLVLNAPNCGGGGPPPAEPVSYTASVTYFR